MISEHSVLGHLAQLPQWGLRGRGSLEAGWHAVYKGRLTDYNVYLSISQDWFYMQCVVLNADIFPECRAPLCEYLLRANNRMFMAKFALVRGREGRGDCVTLVADCPVDNFNSGTFWLMAQAVATYAEQYGREVQAIAVDPKVAALLGDPAVGERPSIQLAGEYKG